MTKAGTGTGKSRRTAKDGRCTFRLDRIKAAMRALGMEESDLVARATVRQSTLNDILNGKRERTARAHLEKIGKALHVPTKWLTGEKDTLPLQPFFHDNPFRSIAECQFALRCNSAYMRDTRRCADAEEKKNRERLQGTFVFAVYALIDHRHWWKWLLEPVQLEPDEPSWRAEPDRRSPELIEDTTEVIIAAIDHLLQPWFDGLATLDYEKVIRLAESM